MRIVLGSDFIGLELKLALAELLASNPKATSVVDLGVLSPVDKTDYPDIAFAVAKHIAAGNAERGLLVCGTGIGMAISANKVAGIRATTAHDPYSLERAIFSNNCQIICFGARVVTFEVAKTLITPWLEYKFDANGPSASKVDKINKFEQPGV